jgi:hypothetical protein
MSNDQRREPVGKFVLAYTGGGAMGETEEEQKEMMDQWMGWFGSLGEAVVDNGAPFGDSSSVSSEETSEPASSGLSGYSIITAESLEAACEAAKGCPVLAGGGSVDVYEVVPVG